MSSPRKVSVKRTTGETDIALTLVILAVFQLSGFSGILKSTAEGVWPYYYGSILIYLALFSVCL